MNDLFVLKPLQEQASLAIKQLEHCNELTARYGLFLSEQQMQTLMEHRIEALKNTGRVEFGEGVLKKLIEVFCDSPYLTQSNYEDILIELQDVFYYFKNESQDRLSDDELISTMKSVFDAKAQGSLEYLAGTALEELCRYARGAVYDDELQAQEEQDDE